MTHIDSIGTPLVVLFIIFAVGFIFAAAHTLAGPAGIAAATMFAAYYVWGRYAHHTHD